MSPFSCVILITSSFVSNITLLLLCLSCTPLSRTSRWRYCAKAYLTAMMNVEQWKKSQPNCLRCCLYHQEPHNNEAFVVPISWARQQSNNPSILHWLPARSSVEAGQSLYLLFSSASLTLLPSLFSPGPTPALLQSVCHFPISKSTDNCPVPLRHSVSSPSRSQSPSIFSWCNVSHIHAMLHTCMQCITQTWCDRTEPLITINGLLSQVVAHRLAHYLRDMYFTCCIQYNVGMLVRWPTSSKLINQRKA